MAISRVQWSLEMCKNSAAQYQTRNAWKKGDENAYASAYRKGWLDICCEHMERVHEQWTLEKCKKSAAKYQSRCAWREGDSKAYYTAVRNRWLDICCAHMEKPLKSYKWTLDACQASAAEYQSRIAWQDGNSGAYQAALRNGWLDICCAHMATLREKWTQEKCKASAAEFQSRSAWENGNVSAYHAAVRNRWMDICCEHMTILHEKWTQDKCKASAADYLSRSAWSKGDSNAYAAALRNGWLDICCKHMAAVPERWTLEKCKASASEYLSRSAWQLGDNKAYEAARRNGWLDICCKHIATVPERWTLEKCKASASEYLSRSAWQLGDNKAYEAARRNGWLDICCEHMATVLEQWSLEKCKASSVEYQSRTAWQNGDSKAYHGARRNGWLDICCTHMERPSKPYKWTLDACKASAAEYQSRSSWEKGNASAYKAARLNGWLDICCTHMERPLKPYKWTLDACKASAAEYQSRSSWEKGNASAYKAARLNGWLDICCTHMERPLKPYKWTLDACKASAAEYQSRSAWQKGNASAYKAAKGKGWLTICCGHMEKPLKPCKWTLDACKASAAEYQSRSSWEKGNASAYKAAKGKGWLTICCGHMEKPLKPCKWTLDACKASAAEYQSRSSWEKGNASAYKAAKGKGWLTICCGHMEKPLKPCKWTLDACKASAAVFKSRGAWKKGDSKAYQAARTKGWLDICCEHMETVLEQWTLEKCNASAAHYETRIAWKNGNMKAYDAARSNRWLTICCQHMKYVNESWSLEKCKESAAEYQSINSWQEGAPKAYNAAQRNGWLDICHKYFDYLLQEITNDECVEDASRYDRWGEWATPDNTFYLKAQSLGCAMMCKDVIMKNKVQKWLKEKGMISS